MEFLRCVALLAALSCSGSLAYHRKPKGFHSKLIADVLWAPTERLVRLGGYECEAHTVHTPDGYELTLHRVPRARRPATANATANATAPHHHTPVLLSHGLAANSEMWTLPGPSIAYYLVDAGFDVWMANYRGSFYGLKHATLNPKMRAFWDFSWNENGLIDQPTIIDYILKTTGKPKLFTLGHSMGTTTQVVMMSEMPDYAKEKVLCSVLIAPPIYFTKAWNEGLMRMAQSIYQMFPPLAIRRSYTSLVLNDRMPFVDRSMVTMCFRGDHLEDACRRLINFLMGTPQSPKVDVALVQLLLAHYPNGASIRQVLHFVQSMRRGGFAKYDYGAVKNRQLYGSPEPPSYNLTAIKTPVYVFYGTADNLVNAKDARKFVNNCPSVKKAYELPNYNHIDFIVGDTENIIKSINAPVLQIFKKYLKNDR